MSVAAPRPAGPGRPARRCRAVVVAGTLLVALAACGPASQHHDMGTMSSPASSAAGPTAGSTSTAAAGAHSDADVMFATMMVPHHQQAVTMSDIVLGKDGLDPAVTALARRIKAAQQPEIATMGGWLAGWGADPSPSTMHDMGGMNGMGDGMMSDADLEALRTATGDDAAKRYLTGMTAHHRGAVVMAERELRNGRNADAKKLARSIVTSQRHEITEMEALLQK